MVVKVEEQSERRIAQKMGGRLTGNRNTGHSF